MNPLNLPKGRIAANQFYSADEFYSQQLKMLSFFC
jgi:hypothetical protein